MFQRETQRWVHHKFIQTHGATDECECAGAGPALQAREIKDISHLWIRVRWPLQGSGRRPEDLPGAQVPMGMLMIFPSNAALRFCWVQYLTEIFLKKNCRAMVVVRLKQNQLVAFTTELWLHSAFSDLHPCRRDMKRNCTGSVLHIPAAVLVPSGHMHFQRASTMSLLLTYTSKRRSSAAISSNTGTISQTTKQVWVQWKCSLCPLAFNILINIQEKEPAWAPS